MADGEMLRVSVKQLARISEVTKARERTKIAEEIDGHAAVELALGNIEVSEKLTVLAESIRPQQPVTVVTQPDMAKLVVKGLEDEAFPGYDAGLDDASLPPMRERGDGEDIHALVRKLGA